MNRKNTRIILHLALMATMVTSLFVVPSLSIGIAVVSLVLAFSFPVASRKTFYGLALERDNHG